jgi:hypothetical protein
MHATELTAYVVVLQKMLRSTEHVFQVLCCALLLAGPRQFGE